jgi:hypothetical protein
LKHGDFASEETRAGEARGVQDPKADKEKKQEYAIEMGELTDFLKDHQPEHMGRFVARLAEEERRYMNRRVARTTSLAVARDALEHRLFQQAAAAHLQDKIIPIGYATKPQHEILSRACVALLSDLHLGSELRARDNPNPYMAIEESRCLEFVIREIADFKPQHRESTELVLLLNGDLIEGKLGHDLLSGSPLTEQKLIFYTYMSRAMGYLASAFKKVSVYCQVGNHGRDKGNRHPGRATEMKWDSLEWELYRGLEMMCSSLLNVTWHIPMQAMCTVPLFESNLLLSHGDTEIKMGHPDTHSAKNAATMHKINSTKIYGVQYDVAAFGHFHAPRVQGKLPTTMIFNGALVPANGYARSEGYLDEKLGQYVWEAVEGYPCGDLRFLRVNAATCRDENLGSIIKPFRLDS